MGFRFLLAMYCSSSSMKVIGLQAECLGSIPLSNFASQSLAMTLACLGLYRCSDPIVRFKTLPRLRSRAWTPKVLVPLGCTRNQKPLSSVSRKNYSLRLPIALEITSLVRRLCSLLEVSKVITFCVVIRKLCGNNLARLSAQETNFQARIWGFAYINHWNN